MGGNRQQKKLVFSVFSVFKARRPRGGDDSRQEAADSGSKVFPSDYDKSMHGVVGDRKVDIKAEIFINKVRHSHAVAAELPRGERQSVTLYPAGN